MASYYFAIIFLHYSVIKISLIIISVSSFIKYTIILILYPYRLVTIVFIILFTACQEVLYLQSRSRQYKNGEHSNYKQTYYNYKQQHILQQKSINNINSSINDNDKRSRTITITHNKLDMYNSKIYQ